MKIAILGSGCGGLFLSLLIKINKPNYSVFVYDKNKIIGRKLYVTGNGRCNLGNEIINDNSYNCDFAYNLIKEYDLNYFKNFLNSIGVETRNIENLVYPYSLSAAVLTDYLIEYAKNIGVVFINNETVLDYKIDGNLIEVITDKSRGSFDKFCISCGGKSHPNLGSDGNLFSVLKNHGYSIRKIKPGLVPLRTIESTNSIQNERVKCRVNLINNGKEIYSEEGEILFKEDGLSGICIMNISSLISRNNFKNPIIKVDLFPNYSKDELVSKILNIKNVETYKILDGFLSKKICRYLLKDIIFKNKKTIEQFDANLIAEKCKNLVFNFKETYDFVDSHVSVGGVELDQIKSTLESKLENNIFMLGEVLNIDGLCGGYNIMVCFAEAAKISSNI